MDYYTQRHNLRAPVEQSEEITVEKYKMLFNCCEQYFDHIAYTYPRKCSDTHDCFELDIIAFSLNMKYEIPDLYRNSSGTISLPEEQCFPWEDSTTNAIYNQYGLLDFIEYMYTHIRDIESKDFHHYFKHYHIHFLDTNFTSKNFRSEINSIFQKTGLLYTLSEAGNIERLLQNNTGLEEALNQQKDINEPGLKELISEAIRLYKAPKPEDRKLSLEKIWDAFERIKTYYNQDDKKKSATLLQDKISPKESHFREYIDTEFETLTKIGNKFRIRHHETNSYEIEKQEYYDYLFNRCMSLINLSLACIKEDTKNFKKLSFIVPF